MKKLMSMFVMLASFGSASIYADEQGAQIKFSGKVAVAPCSVETDSVLIDFGEFLTNSWDNSAKGKFIPTKIKLVNCPPYTNKVTALFTGEPDPQSPNYYKNKGSAKNVQIELKEKGQAGEGLESGKKLTADVKPDHTALFDLESRVNSEGKNATPGTIEGVVQVSFTYQ
ncbi:fimbrial protein [Aeromonas salmonicida]|uniref:fimbrial protein n=1 Tax=Aeromonas salmonicida TaxID=645 RepID=UPI002796C38C|nr:fimbrial protein [Aeromonas salmonicida]MDQ1884173.1 fimbrial protein [Aeromonas salmonicida]